MQKCISIEVFNKKLFTHKKNYNKLKEFTKITNAVIKPALASKTDILNLEELKKEICMI